MFDSRYRSIRSCMPARPAPTNRAGSQQSCSAPNFDDVFKIVVLFNWVYGIYIQPIPTPIRLLKDPIGTSAPRFPTAALKLSPWPSSYLKLPFSKLYNMLIPIVTRADWPE